MDIFAPSDRLDGDLCQRPVRPQPTELLLSNSRLTGVPILTNINRQYLARAVRLGFREIGLINADAILTCRDARRTYAWMPLAQESAVKKSPDCFRIESYRSAPATNFDIPQNSPQPITTQPPMNRISESARQTRNTPPDASPARPAEASSRPQSAIELALTLRDSLRVAANQAHDLAQTLKRQRRESQLVKATLASLEQLQRAAA